MISTPRDDFLDLSLSFDFESLVGSVFWGEVSLSYLFSEDEDEDGECFGTTEYTIYFGEKKMGLIFFWK